MLYRTHHQPFFFPFNPLTSSIYPPSTTTSSPTISPAAGPIPPIQGMDCVDGALKGGLRPDTAAKRTQQQRSLDDLWTVNGQNGVSGDESFVDDLLDFSKEGIEDGFLEAEEETENIEDKTKGSSVSVAPEEKEHKTEKEKDSDPSRSNFSVVENFSELSVPADDLADLEWLSHFVEDSFSEYSLTLPAGKLPEKPFGELEIPVPAKPCFTTPVQTKARSKRARTGGRVWSLGSPSVTETSSSSSSSSSSISSASPSNPALTYASPVQATAESLLGQLPQAKKQKKKPETVGGSGGPQQPRRCSHCLVQKTPQWRAGPLGAKTLCNACGVRFKSGRLFPEYRPACSPTYSSEVHSNNHRKVLEMRRKKEMEAELSPPVQGF